MNRRLLNEHATHTNKSHILPATSLTSTLFHTTKTAQSFFTRTLSIFALFLATTFYQEDLVAARGKKHFSSHHEQQQKNLVDSQLVDTQDENNSFPHEHSQKSLIAAIKNYSCPHRHEYQQELMQSFHKERPLDLDCAETLEALLVDNTTPFLTEHAATLFAATRVFKNIPGFSDTFYKVLGHARYPDTARGFLYEIEVALRALEQGERIVSFGQRHQSTSERSLNREIDVETERHLFECKDILWDKIRKIDRQEKLKRQLIDEQQLALEQQNSLEQNKHSFKHKRALKQNKYAALQKLFVLCSKHPIPADWQEWLDKQKISYCCTSDKEGSSNSLSRRSSISGNNG